MTIQEAAGEILIENGHPLYLIDLAEMVHNKNASISKAIDPLDSIKKTIHSNIMRGRTIGPKLIYIETPKGKLVAFSSWR